MRAEFEDLRTEMLAAQITSISGSLESLKSIMAVVRGFNREEFKPALSEAAQACEQIDQLVLARQYTDLVGKDVAVTRIQESFVDACRDIFNQLDAGIRNAESKVNSELADLPNKIPRHKKLPAFQKNLGWLLNIEKDAGGCGLILAIVIFPIVFVLIAVSLTQLILHESKYRREKVEATDGNDRRRGELEAIKIDLSNQSSTVSIMRARLLECIERSS